MVNSMLGVSVIIPTYNGAKVISKALIALVNQKAPFAIEILVVNNMSTDNTVDIVQDLICAFSNTNDISIRLIEETRPGKYFAQDTGIKQALNNIVVICDDDNILSNNYCHKAFQIFASSDKVGVLGGRGRPVFENGFKPTWFELYRNYYAVGSQGEKSQDITDLKGCVYGAGMIVRRDYYLKLFENGHKPIFLSRSGLNLSSGSEDTELCYAFRIFGYRIFYSEELVFDHFIENRKLEFNYLRRIVLSQARATIFDLPYQSFFLNKTIKSILWIQIVELVSLNSLKYIFYFLTNYKWMRIHSIFFFYSRIVLLSNLLSFDMKPIIKPRTN
jgi:glycosyltransferase involved in cell wall biosynthesis